MLGRLKKAFTGMMSNITINKMFIRRYILSIIAPHL